MIGGTLPVNPASVLRRQIAMTAHDNREAISVDCMRNAVGCHRKCAELPILQ